MSTRVCTRVGNVAGCVRRSKLVVRAPARVSVRRRRRTALAVLDDGGDQAFDMLGGQSFVALDLLVIDLLAVLERAKAVTFDAAEMHENILAVGIHDEPETLFGIEPLDGSNRHGRSPYNKRKLFDHPACGI